MIIVNFKDQKVHKNGKNMVKKIVKERESNTISGRM